VYLLTPDGVITYTHRQYMKIDGQTRSFFCHVFEGDKRMDKDFYAELLRDALGGLMSRQPLSESQKRQLQHFRSRDRPYTLNADSLRDMLNTQDLNQQQVEDLLWLLQMMKNIPQKRDSHELLQPVLVEFEQYHKTGVLGANALTVRNANEVVSHRGEMFLRGLVDPSDNILDFIRLNLYVFEAHGAVNRHALALYRARVARMALEDYVGGNFVSHPNTSSYARKLYIDIRLAEAVATRDLLNSKNASSHQNVLNMIREIRHWLDNNVLGEIENSDLLRLKLLRDEIRTLSRTSRCTVGEIDFLYGQSQAILAKNPHYGENHLIQYMQMETEIKGFLRTRSNRDGIRMALERARQLPLEIVDTLDVGIGNRITILRALAMLGYKTKDSDTVNYILSKAYHLAHEARLLYKLTLIDEDFRRFGLK